MSLPAVLVGAWVLTNIGDGYYWPTYLIVATAFLVASFLFGFLLSPRPRGARFREAWTRLFLGGALGWISALATFGALNLTPLCVGQDNGDGINNLALCMSYTFIVTVVYSPLILTLLATNAALGGAFIRVRKGGC